MRNRSARPSARARPGSHADRPAAAVPPPDLRARALRARRHARVARAAPPDAARDAPPSTLDVVPDGNGTVTIESAAAAAVVCTGSPDTRSLENLEHCAYDVAPGQEVTLTATPNAEPPEVEPKTTFVGWSDARCPGTGPCALRIDSDWQSVTALFSPQRVTVKSHGPGTVTTPTGDECRPAQDGRRRFLDCGRFPILSQVPLQAKPSEPQNPSDPPVSVTWEPLLCDSPAPKQGDLLCTLSVIGPTEGRVFFNDEPGGDLNPTIRVSFRVLKRGSGSGTVRSESLDCGRRCDLDGHFGDRETLVADPAPGSTFTGWRGLCSSAPQCSLAVGPVTTVVAVFDDAEGGSGASDRKPESRRERSPRRAPFAARLKRIAVSGHGRHRRVLMRVQVNAPATVRARPAARA